MFSGYPLVPSPKNRGCAAGLQRLNHDQLKMLRAFIQKRVMNPADVDDILQSTFLEAIRNEQKFLGSSKLQTWLCGIAMNLIRNYFRRMYKRPYQESWEDQVHSNIALEGDIGVQVDGRRQLARTVDAIAELPANMQQIIKINVEMEGNYRDTASMLGVPIGTVRSRLSRARDQLKKRMGPGTP